MKFVKLNLIALILFCMCPFEWKAQANDDGAPVMMSIGQGDQDPGNAPASLDLGQASQQYVEEHRLQRKEGAPERYLLLIALIAVLSVGGIAYAIHPHQKNDSLRNSVG